MSAGASASVTAARADASGGNPPRRILFVVPPFPSHVFPTVAIAAALAARGHAVAWVAYAGMRRVLPDAARFYPLASPLSEERAQQLLLESGASWLAGMKVLFEDVVFPMAYDMLPGVEAAIDDFAPDALVVDQMALAGAIVARRRGLRWATSATTAALTRDSVAQYPKVEAWLAGLSERLQRDAGVAPVRRPDTSPALVLLYTSRLLAGPDAAYPAHFRFIGPVLAARREVDDFPWDALDDRRRVFVTLGSLWLDRGERFFRIVREALADLPLQVIVSAPARLMPDPPPNFIVRPWVPAMLLYPRLDAVVTHAGTTVNEAFAHGLPAVVAPIVHDQSIFADLAVGAGAAVRIAFTRVTAAQMRDAVFAILDDPAYRDAARRIQASFREAGGEQAAAIAIEELCAAPRVDGDGAETAPA
jgi:MGT family glycosyltransferase